MSEYGRIEALPLDGRAAACIRAHVEDLVAIEPNCALAYQHGRSDASMEVLEARGIIMRLHGELDEIARLLRSIGMAVERTPTGREVLAAVEALVELQLKGGAA